VDEIHYGETGVSLVASALLLASAQLLPVARGAGDDAGEGGGVSLFTELPTVGWSTWSAAEAWWQSRATT
jgi:hypothetical protein